MNDLYSYLFTSQYLCVLLKEKERERRLKSNVKCPICYTKCILIVEL